MGKLIYTDSSGQEQVVPFGAEAPLVTIGRATDCTIRSNRKSVSRHHAEFRYHAGGYEVFDKGSSNGTYLIVKDNRQQIHGRAPLSHLDEIWCGDFILYFYGDEVGLSDADSDPTQHSPEIPSFNAPGMAAQSFGAQPYQTNPSGGGFGAQPYQTSPEPAAQQPPNANFGAQPYQSVPEATNANFGAQPYDPFGAQPYDPFGAQPYDPYGQPQTPPPQHQNHGQQHGIPSGSGPYAHQQPALHQSGPQVLGHGLSEASYSSPYDELEPQEIEVEPLEDGPWGNDDTNHDLRVDPNLLHGFGAQESSGVNTPMVQLPPSATAAPDAGLLREKQLLEEMASKQARELEELKAQLRMKTKELDSLRASSMAPTGPSSNEQHLSGELEQAKQRYQQLEQIYRESEQELEGIRPELDHYQQRALDLERQLQDQEVERERAHSIAVKLQEQEQQRRQLQEQLDAAMAQLHQHQTQDLERGQQLRHSTQELERQLERAQDELRASAQESERLRQELVTTRDEGGQLRRQLESLSVAAQGSEALRREIDRNKRLLDEFERRNRELQSELEEAERECGQLGQAVAANQSKVAEIEALAAARQDKLTALTEQKTLLAEELSRLRLEQEELLGQRLEHEQELERSSAQAQETERALEQTLSQTQEELSQERTLRQRHEVQLLELREQVQRWEPQLTELGKENEGLRHRLKLDKEHQREELRRLKQELEQARAALTQSSGSSEELAALKGQLEQANRANQAEHQQVIALEEALSAAQDALEQRDERVRALEQEHERITQALAQLQEQHTAQAAAQDAADQAAAVPDVEFIKALYERVDKLSRMIDAIDRADINALSTVDRVRLRSAIKDTMPKETLAELKTMLHP